jgi:hypothetical protein
MSAYEYALESDEIFETDESADEASDEANVSFRGYRLPTIPSPRTSNGTGLFKPRPGQFVTPMQLQLALAGVSKELRQNSESIKKVVSQVNRVNSQIAAADARRDKEIAGLKKELKRQSEAGLLPLLLQKPPQLDVTKGTGANAAVVTDVKVKAQDNMTMLLALMMGGGGGGFGGGDNNMLPLVLLMANR